MEKCLEPAYLEKKAKIVATLGPASQAPATIAKLIQSGANVFRLNFSHGTHEQHAITIKNIRAISKKLGHSVAILADLQGPKIRTGETENNAAVTLLKGTLVTVTDKKVLCTDSIISVSYKNLASEVAVGQGISINDGTIKLSIEKVDKKTGNITCKVLNTGIYSSHKGVNFPDVNLTIQSLTPKDRRDLDFICLHDINFVALSFVRSEKDLKVLNAILKKNNPSLKVIAKIEKPQALTCLDAILDNCDGIMVARGDLGVETSPYEVPVLQKRFILAANQKGKFVIVATQMLESMTENPIPTRAEATDVANAIFDGTDAVMLSAETASGAYPVEAVQTMSCIIAHAENSEFGNHAYYDLNTRPGYAPHSICEAAERASRDLGYIPVCIFTMTGETATYMAKIRNQSPIFAFSPDSNTAAMLSLAWNVKSFVLPIEKELPHLISKAEKILLKHGAVTKESQLALVIGSSPVSGATSVLRIKTVGKE
jgi:pyruvate kinase